MALGRILGEASRLVLPVMSIAVENINERFDAAFAIHRGSRLRKLMRGTVGIADSKLLEVLLKLSLIHI